MVGVHLGDHERDVRLHPERLRVRDDELSARGLERLHGVRDGGIERGEAARETRSLVLAGDDEVARVGRDVARKDPARRLGVRFPADLSDAATSARTNRGWPSSSETSRCPTAPVAPRTATGIRKSGRHAGLLRNEKARRFRRALVSPDDRRDRAIYRTPHRPPRGGVVFFAVFRFRAGGGVHVARSVGGTGKRVKAPTPAPRARPQARW